MKECILIGYGKLGKQFESYLRSEYPHLEFSYYDDIACNQGLINANPFINYTKIITGVKNSSVCISLGYKHLRLKSEIISYLPKECLLGFVHQSSFVDENANVGLGSFIYPKVSVDNDSQVGICCVLNTGSILCHDSEIGNCSFIGPNVTICGDVKIGERCFIGAGSIISNNVVLGDDVIVGAGSLISSNIPSNKKVVGNPFKFVDKLNVI